MYRMVRVVVGTLVTGNTHFLKKASSKLNFQKTKVENRMNESRKNHARGGRQIVHAKQPGINRRLPWDP
jgi:predicted metal-dependent phosphotriesterase family hydrolase